MKGKFAQLHHIEQNEKITRESHYEIWYDLEQDLLLALRERGTLNVMQYRLAMERLKQQRCDRTRRLREESL